VRESDTHETFAAVVARERPNLRPLVSAPSTREELISWAILVEAMWMNGSILYNGTHISLSIICMPWSASMPLR